MHRRTALGLGLLPFLPVAARAATGGTAALPITIGMQTAPDWDLIAARGLHFIEKAGLRPNYLRFPAGAAMLAAAESKSVDLSVPGCVPFIAGLAQGVPWVAIGIDVGGADGEGIVVRRDANIHTIADLRGKRIGYYRASTAQYGIGVALKRAGVPLDSVHLLSLAPAAQVAAMRAGQIDAAEVWEPWMQKMIHQANGRILAREADFGDYATSGFFAVRRDWLAAHRETARRFLAANIAAYDALQKNPGPSIAVFAKAAGIEPAWSRAVFKDTPPLDPRQWVDPDAHFSVVPGGKFQTTALEPVMRFLVDLHVIPHPVDLSHALDDSVLREVLATLPKVTRE